MDNRILILRESGIFENAIKITLNPRRLGPDVWDKIETEQDFDDVITIYQLRGIFILYIIFSPITIVIFKIECVIKYYHK